MLLKHFSREVAAGPGPCAVSAQQQACSLTLLYRRLLTELTCSDSVLIDASSCWSQWAGSGWRRRCLDLWQGFYTLHNEPLLTDTLRCWS